MLSNFFKRAITSLILIMILFIGLFYNEISWKALVIFFLLLCFYEFYNLTMKINKNKFANSIFLFMISLYLYFFYSLLIRIKFEFGEIGILILIITCIFSDIGGYVFGKLIGGVKLTSISPNKTISGAFGSIIFTVFGTILFVFFLNKIEKNPIDIELSFIFYFWLIMMSLFCQIGDLCISYLKRKAKVKDTGNLLPGHGGILDRVDGIIFAIPFGVLTYFILFLRS